MTPKRKVRARNRAAERHLKLLLGCGGGAPARPRGGRRVVLALQPRRQFLVCLRLRVGALTQPVALLERIFLCGSVCVTLKCTRSAAALPIPRPPLDPSQRLDQRRRRHPLRSTRHARTASGGGPRWHQVFGAYSSSCKAITGSRWYFSSKKFRSTSMGVQPTPPAGRREPRLPCAPGLISTSWCGPSKPRCCCCCCCRCRAARACWYSAACRPVKLRLGCLHQYSEWTARPAHCRPDAAAVSEHCPGAQTTDNSFDQPL